MIDPKESSFEDEEKQLFNDPEPIQDVSENIQQTVAVMEVKNIINDNPNKDEL